MRRDEFRAFGGAFEGFAAENKISQLATSDAIRLRFSNAVIPVGLRASRQEAGDRPRSDAAAERRPAITLAVSPCAPPIMWFSARVVWIDDALSGAARCRQSALRQRGIAAFDVVALIAVRLFGFTSIRHTALVIPIISRCSPAPRLPANGSGPTIRRAVLSHTR
jgi:hypothetical protein